jgi:hypothetical protein
MLLILPLTRIGPLKNKITSINLACIFVATMTTAFYLGINCWLVPGSIWYADRILNVPEEVSMAIIPTWVAPTPDICRQIVTGGVPIPWDQWLAPIVFWWLLDVVIAIFMLSLTNIFRRQWIDVEKVPFPHAVSIHELISTNTRLAGTTPKIAGRLRLFFLGALIGLFLQGTVTLGAYFPWFPDIFGWRENTCATGLWNIPRAMPALAQIAGMTGINKLPAVIGIAYFVPLSTLFNAWFWFLIYLVVVQALYAMGYYTGITELGACGKLWCHPSVMNDPPLVLSAVFNGGILAFVIMHLIITRSYLLDTVRAAIGKGKFVETEKDEPVSYRTTYALLGASFIAFMAILLALGTGPTAIFVPITVFILFVFNSRLWGLTGVWANGNNCQFGGILGRYTFWQGAAPNPPTKEFIYTNVLPLQQDDPNWGWYGTACASFASYRITNLSGLSNKTTMKIILGAALIVPFFYLVSFIIMLYTFGANKIPATAWMQGCGLASCAYREQWQAKPGLQQTPQMLAGFIITTVLTFLHSRFVWFPFEPMGFMLALSYPGIRSGFWFSFLVAWIAKTLTLRIGGSKLYEEVGMPAAGGMLAGTMVAVLFGGLLGIYRTFFPF